jgi:hypothetical protein
MCTSSLRQQVQNQNGGSFAARADPNRPAWQQYGGFGGGLIRAVMASNPQKQASSQSAVQVKKSAKTGVTG